MHTNGTLISDEPRPIKARAIEQIELEPTPIVVSASPGVDRVLFAISEYRRKLRALHRHWEATASLRPSAGGMTLRGVSHARSRRLGPSRD